MRTARINPFTLDELLGVVDVQSARTGRYADVTLVLGLTGLRLGSFVGCTSGTL